MTLCSYSDILKNAEHPSHDHMVELFAIIRCHGLKKEEYESLLTLLLKRETALVLHRIYEGVALLDHRGEEEATETKPTLRINQATPVVSRFEQTIAPCFRKHTFDLKRDIASAVCGKSVLLLVLHPWFWKLFASIIIFAAVPTLVLNQKFGVSCGYPQACVQPTWLLAFECLTISCLIPFIFILFASLQVDIAKKAVLQPATFWIFIVSSANCAAIFSIKYSAGRNLLLDWPMPVIGVLMSILVPLSDALPGKSRLYMLRYFALVTLVRLTRNAITIRLPAALDAPGRVTWMVLGNQTISNYDVQSAALPVLALLMIEGVFSAWRRPKRLAFLRDDLEVSSGTNSLRANMTRIISILPASPPPH